MRILIGTFILVLSGFAIYGQFSKSEHPIRKPVVLTQDVGFIPGSNVAIRATVVITPTGK